MTPQEWIAYNTNEPEPSGVWCVVANGCFARADTMSRAQCCRCGRVSATTYKPMQKDSDALWGLALR